MIGTEQINRVLLGDEPAFNPKSFVGDPLSAVVRDALHKRASLPLLLVHFELPPALLESQRPDQVSIENELSQRLRGDSGGLPHIRHAVIQSLSRLFGSAQGRGQFDLEDAFWECLEAQNLSRVYIGEILWVGSEVEE